MQNTHPLSEAKEHSRLHITAIKTSSKTLLRLMGLGLVTGNTIEVMRNRRGDIVLSNGNSRISIGHSVADKIHVHEVTE
jgi:Fe2+ transport system protein FeoA